MDYLVASRRPWLRIERYGKDLNYPGFFMGHIEGGPRLDFTIGNYPEINLEPGLWKIRIEGRERFWVNVWDNQIRDRYTIVIDINYEGMESFEVLPDPKYQSFILILDNET